MEDEVYVTVRARVLQWGSIGVGNRRSPESDYDLGDEQRNHIFQTLRNLGSWAAEFPLVLLC